MHFLKQIIEIQEKVLRRLTELATPKGIVKKTDKDRKQRAKKISDVRLTTVLKKGTATGANMRWIYSVTSQSQPGKRYRVDVRSTLKKQITEDNWKDIVDMKIPLMVNCECADFKYRWETVLWKGNLSRKQLSDGSWPDITNPKHKKAYCKHVLAVITELKKYVKRKSFKSIKAR